MFEKLDRELDSFLDMGTPGYDMCIYRNGECIYRRLAGYSDRENKIPMKGDELYYIYSVSKVITVTAALQLYEKGVFKLGDPLSKYHSGFEEMLVRDGDTVRKAKNPITVKDLFCMSAGYNYRLKGQAMLDFYEGTDNRCPTRELAKYLATAVLDFEPGTNWQYSLCHDLLASFIEIWTGEKFGEYVRKNIFEPAGMTRSAFYLAPEDRVKLAPQYKYDYSTHETNLTEPTNCYGMWPEYESGGGGCVSTVDDMIRFAEALRTGKLLKKETVDLMTTNHIEKHLESFVVEKYAYGLGVRCSKDGNDDVTDFGWGGAAGADLWIDIENGLSVYYAQHVLNTPVIKKRNALIFLIKDCLGISHDYQPDSEAHGSDREGFASKFGN